MPYKLDYKYRGTALIIGNECLERGFRAGCKKDVTMMEELFKRLDFHVTTYYNLPAAKMRKKIEDASKNKENEECDCFVLVLSTHGAEDKYLDKKLKNPPKADIWRHGVLGEDGVILYVDEIMDYFTDKACTLDGKPKFFFIQACRSRNFDLSAIHLSPGDTYDTGHKIKQTVKDTSGEKENKGDTKDMEDVWLYQIDLSDTDDIYSQWEKDPDALCPEEMTKTSGTQPSQIDAAEFSEEDAGGSGDSGQMPQSPFDIVPIKCPDDCLIMYPVMSGKSAFRNPSAGSYLLKFLHESKNLAMLLRGCNILQYLTQVSRDMSNYEFKMKLDDISIRNRQKAAQAKLRGEVFDPLDTFKDKLYSNIKYLSSTENQEVLIEVIGKPHRKNLEGDPAIVEPYLHSLIKNVLKEDQMKEILEIILPFKMTACTVHRLKGEVCFLPKDKVDKNTPMQKLKNALLLKKLRQ